MNVLPLVVDASIKAGCPTFSIRYDGEVDGYNHGPGFLIPEFKGELKFHLEFMANKNAKKTRPWMIGFTHPKSFHYLTNYSPILDIFSPWSGAYTTAQPFQNSSLHFIDSRAEGVVFHCMRTSKSIKTILILFQTTFHSRCEVVHIDSIHITSVNQITGARLDEWNAKPGTFMKDECSFYKSGLLADVWYSSEPFPNITPIPYHQFTIPEMKKIPGICIAPDWGDIDNYIGAPKIRQMSDTKTTIVCCLPRLFRIYLGNFEKSFIQVCTSSHNSPTQLVAPMMI